MGLEKVTTRTSTNMLYILGVCPFSQVFLSYLFLFRSANGNALRIITWEHFVELHGESPICRVIGFEPERTLDLDVLTNHFLTNQTIWSGKWKTNFDSTYVGLSTFLEKNVRHPSRLYAFGALGLWNWRCDQRHSRCGGPSKWLGAWEHPRQTVGYTLDQLQRVGWSI